MLSGGRHKGLKSGNNTILFYILQDHVNCKMEKRLKVGRRYLLGDKDLEGEERFEKHRGRNRML